MKKAVALKNEGLRSVHLREGKRLVEVASGQMGVGVPQFVNAGKGAEHRTRHRRVDPPRQEFLQRFQRAPFFALGRENDLLDGGGVYAVGRETRQILREREEASLIGRPEAVSSSHKGIKVSVFPKEPRSELG
jgi:hypothetical protein